MDDWTNFSTRPSVGLTTLSAHAQFCLVIRTTEFHVGNNLDDPAAKIISATPWLLTLSILSNGRSLDIFGIGHWKGTHILNARSSFAYSKGTHSFRAHHWVQFPNARRSDYGGCIQADTGIGRSFALTNNYLEDNAAKVISTTPWLLTLSTLSNKWSPHICGIVHSESTPVFQSFGGRRVPSVGCMYTTALTF